MDETTTRFFDFPDGRRLCYAEYGDPSGQVIFLFHGNPGSRLLWGKISGSPFLPNIRLIAPDRPGFGQTDFIEGVTTVENWPNDIVALADALGINKFSVFGPSGGGPFALACAWKIPKRLNAVGIFAGVGPLVPEVVEDIAPPVRLLWSKAPKVPGLFKLQMKLMAWLAKRKPRLYVKMVLKEFSEFDREVYERLNIAELIQTDRNEAYRQGGIGTWYDAMIPATWPIPLNEIKVKVHIWQGEEDASVPPSMGKYMAEKIPKCEATFVKGAGHFWFFEHVPEMLQKLMDNDE